MPDYSFTGPDRNQYSFDEAGGVVKYSWNGTIFHYKFDATHFEQGRHYQMCIKKNSTLNIGHSASKVYVNPIVKLKHFTLRMQNDNWMQVSYC